jgi:hypothetical protein
MKAAARCGVFNNLAFESIAGGVSRPPATEEEDISTWPNERSEEQGVFTTTTGEEAGRSRQGIRDLRDWWRQGDARRDTLVPAPEGFMTKGLKRASSV